MRGSMPKISYCETWRVLSRTINQAVSAVISTYFGQHSAAFHAKRDIINGLSPRMRWSPAAISLAGLRLGRRRNAAARFDDATRDERKMAVDALISNYSC